MITRISRAAALIALICLTGWVSHQLAGPTDYGYVSPIWPPAGISLAALLLWGRHYWPAVWIASFALHLGLVVAHGLPVPGSVVFCAAGVACGSTLQALCAAWLTQKWGPAGVPRLDSPRSIVVFFTLGGALASVVAPTIGVGTLLYSGVMPQSATLFAWCNWWLGCTMGTIIVTPLMFCLLAPPRELWAPRRLTVALPLLLLLAALTTAFHFVLRAEQARVQLEFNHRASVIGQRLTERLSQIINGALSLRDLYGASSDVDRQDFAAFSRGVLARNPELQSMEWLPRVPQLQLKQFEKSIRAQGFPQFKVRELALNGSLEPVHARPEYFPILFLEPYAGNKRALGYDSASNPASWHPKALAVATGKPTVSQKMKLLQDGDDEYGVLISAAVYRHGTTPVPAHLSGFISGTFRPRNMVLRTLAGLNPEQFGIALLDLDAPQAERGLFNLPPKHPLIQGDAFSPWQRTFLFGDREWQFVITPDRNFITAQSSQLAWFTLIGGFLFTSLLNIFLLTITGQTAHIKALVEKRTREAQESEKRLHFLLMTSPIAIRIAKNGGREVVFANPRYDELLMAEPGHALMLDPKTYYACPQDYEDILQQLALGMRVDNRLIELAIPGKCHKWALASYLQIEYEEVESVIGWFYDITDRVQTTQALQESETNLRSAQEIARLGSWMLDGAADKLTWSEQTCRIFGVEPGTTMTYQTFMAYVHPDDLKRVERTWQHALDGVPYDIEHRILVNGQTRWVHEHAELKLGADHQLLSGLGTVQDITERKQVEEKLVLAARVFAEAHEGISITDTQGIILDVNPTFSEITGYAREEVIGKASSMLHSGKHPKEFYQAMWAAMTEQGQWHGEVWNRKKSGELYAELLTISGLRDEDGNILHYVGLFSDITQSKRQQQTLEMMAHYDVLTQLPNRVLFADRFNQAIAHCKRDDECMLAVCYLDLDGFKQINDTLGHDAGDQLLVQVAERIKSILREEDTVSRLGGDEFALLLGEIRTTEQCEQALERIHRTIAQPYLIEGQNLTISASSGVSIYPWDDADPDTLLRHADQAMYQAKLAGRNRYHLFDNEHDQKIQHHSLQLAEIEQAFERNEFCLHYQPKINMKTGEVFGAEALIRWIHPERSIVPPADFLPIIAGTPFEVPLGNWVMEEAMNQVIRWNEAGLELQVSVNISPTHLQWQGFFMNLDAALSRHPDMHSHQFELEVLESSVVENVASISEVLSGCRDVLGVNIALDDFGTGYSSLTHLRHLPANMIKIDQSFVRDILDDPDDYAIAKGVVGLAGAFRRGVIAEGVESAEHGLLLLNMGCMLAQGYGIARAMPAADMPAWVRNYRPCPAWLDFVQHPPSSRQALKVALQLEVRQWLNRMTECLHTSPGTAPRWPIMNPAKCHCGRWAAHVKPAGLYSDHSLAEFQLAHENLHHTGQRLMTLYQQDKTLAAQDELPDLQSAYEDFMRILDEMD